MTKINRGKQFEGVIKKAFQRVEDLSIDRLHDQTTGFRGSSNVSDYIVYYYPYQYYFECKTTNSNTLPLANITDKQLSGMLEKSCIKGVDAGIICWWVNCDETWFIPIHIIQDAKESGLKSINIKKPYMQEQWTEIKGKKKRVFFEYDMKSFLDTLWEKAEW